MLGSVWADVDLGCHLVLRSAAGSIAAYPASRDASRHVVRPQLAARGLTKSFGGRAILRGLDLDVEAGSRIGILGPNGGGKSTLLRIVAGLDHPDAGTVTRRRGLVLAHLPQIVDGDERDALRTVRAARPGAGGARGRAARRRGRARRPARSPSDLDAMTRALAHHERLLARWTEAGGDRAEGEALGHLRALGIDGRSTCPRASSPAASASSSRSPPASRGGPDVLLLDEPEAHLDMSRRERLGALLDDFDGAVVMISHDRHLLDATRVARSPSSTRA